MDDLDAMIRQLNLITLKQLMNDEESIRDDIADQFINHHFEEQQRKQAATDATK